MERVQFEKQLGQYLCALRRISRNTMSDLNQLLHQGLACHQSGRLEEAKQFYDQIIKIEPNHFDALQFLASLQRQLKNYEVSLGLFNKALAINSGNHHVHLNCGNLLNELDRWEEAIHCYDNAISLNKDYPDAYCKRGDVLKKLNRFEEAIESYDRAISLRPNYVEAHANRGNALQELLRLDEAIEDYVKAIGLKPDVAEVYWNLSIAKLAQGNFQEGWELYDWRLLKDDAKKKHYSFPKPAWRGQENIRGKKLLIYGEQGFGDVIQFCRYLPLIKQFGADIIFEVAKPLVGLMSSLDCSMTIITKGDPIPEFDAYCPVMSLPYAFKTTLKTIPSEIPYLYADKKKVEYWNNKLGQRDRLRVGFVWSGSTTHKNDNNRSIQLENLLPLINLSIDCHSLQKEYRNHDLEVLSRHPEMKQHQDGLHNFSDTAALIECMDLVISVDTSVAHVAGAIGKPVWVMLPYAPDFRWMLERDDSPWYQTAKLFRQPKRGDWQSVVVSVQKSLLKMLQES